MVPCEVRPEEPDEGVTADIEKRLKSRKKTWPGQSEEDRWREVYQILFPNDEIPSPCKIFTNHLITPLFTDNHRLWTLWRARRLWRLFTTTYSKSFPEVTRKSSKCQPALEGNKERNSRYSSRMSKIRLPPVSSRSIPKRLSSRWLNQTTNFCTSSGFILGFQLQRQWQWK
jgi:hypothetical protein